MSNASKDMKSELRDAISALLGALGRMSRELVDPSQRLIVGSMLTEAEVLARQATSLVASGEHATSSLAVYEAALTSQGDDRGRFTILVVDDDATWLESAHGLLSRYFTVLSATDGLEASELLSKHHPDVVLTDLFMPGTDGLALMELARTHDDTAAIPVIVLSGSDDTDVKVRAFEAGAFDYVTKPVALNELVVRIRNALAHCQALRRERTLQETDDLTGLPNRRALRTFLAVSLRHANKTGKPLIVAMVDMDGLKKVNDRYGHPVGDEAILCVARSLGRAKRDSDFAARLGGDEFVVVMPGTDRAGSERLCTRVQAELNRHPLRVPDGDPITLTASFGLASPGDVAWEETWEQLLERADTALYAVKAERKARDASSSAGARPLGAAVRRRSTGSRSR